MDNKRKLSILVSVLTAIFFLSGPVCSFAEEVTPDIRPFQTEDISPKKPKYSIIYGDLMLEEHSLWFGNKINFIPNSPIIISPKVELYGLTLGLKLPLVSKDPEGRDMGSTDFHSFHTSLRIKFVELLYYKERYKGFYLKDQIAPDGNYYIFSDLETKREGGEVKLYYGYSTRDKLFESITDMTVGVSTVHWGTSLSLLREKTRISKVPQSGSFTNASDISFSHAEFSSNMPKIGVTFVIMQKLKWASPQAFFYEASFDLGQGRADFSYTDLGQVKEKKLKTLSSRFELDAGIMSKNIVAGIKVTSYDLIIDEMDAEIGTVSFGFYGSMLF